MYPKRVNCSNNAKEFGIHEKWEGQLRENNNIPIQDASQHLSLFKFKTLIFEEFVNKEDKKMQYLFLTKLEKRKGKDYELQQKNSGES